MKSKVAFNTWVVVLAAVCVFGLGAVATAEDETPEQAGEKVGVVGQFVRVAETDEGWVVVGYKIANGSVNDEWMLLDVGMTVLSGAKSQKITRDQVKLVTPDNQVVSLASQEEFSKARGSLAALNERANTMGDSINYFPPGTDQPCRIGFFNDPSKPMVGLAYDEVELDSQRACMGRLFFQVPGGIQLGNYNLDVAFANSVVRVPIQIMTKDEAKEFEKKWKEAQKEAKEKK